MQDQYRARRDGLLPDRTPHAESGVPDHLRQGRITQSRTLFPTILWSETRMTNIASPEAEKILQRIQARRGHVWPLHHLMAELDPRFLDLFDEAYVHTLGFTQEDTPNALDAKYRELICACACAMSPVPLEVTAHHLERAYALGLTETQAIQGFHALLIPAGGIALSNGVRAMLKIREDATPD